MSHLAIWLIMNNILLGLSARYQGAGFRRSWPKRWGYIRQNFADKLPRTALGGEHFLYRTFAEISTQNVFSGICDAGAMNQGETVSISFTMRKAAEPWASSILVPRPHNIPFLTVPKRQSILALWVSNNRLRSVAQTFKTVNQDNLWNWQEKRLATN